MRALISSERPSKLVYHHAAERARFLFFWCSGSSAFAGVMASDYASRRLGLLSRHKERQRFAIRLSQDVDFCAEGKGDLYSPDPSARRKNNTSPIRYSLAVVLHRPADANCVYCFRAMSPPYLLPCRICADAIVDGIGPNRSHGASALALVVDLVSAARDSIPGCSLALAIAAARSFVARCAAYCRILLAYLKPETSLLSRWRHRVPGNNLVCASASARDLGLSANTSAAPSSNAQRPAARQADGTRSAIVKSSSCATNAGGAAAAIQPNRKVPTLRRRGANEPTRR